MADITQEIETLATYLGGVATFARVWRQHLPLKYTANEMSIRYLGDSSESETAYHFRIDREYQVVYFATTEIACLQRATLLQRAINQQIKIPVKDATGYMSLVSFSISQPFKTDTDGVFAVVGVLQAQVREARYFAPVPKVMNVEATITQKE